MLIGARALQGLGAALISPAALSIIATTFAEGAERAKALGVWAAIAIGGSAVGLVLGGVLTQYFSWPWIFFVNVPVGIVAFVLSLRLIPESRDEHAQRSYDIAGAVTVTGGLMALVYAIVDAAAGGLGLREDARLLRARGGAARGVRGRSSCARRRRSCGCRSSAIRSLLTANVAMLLAMSGMFAMFFFNTLYIQRVLGYGPLKAGLAFLPFTARDHGLGRARVAVRAADRRPARRRGRLRADARPGSLLLTQLPVHGSYVADVLPSIILSSLGMGAVFMPLTLIATTGLEDADQGLASGPLQHVAADRRRARPRGPLDARHEQDARRRAARRRTRSSSASTGRSRRARS